MIQDIIVILIGVVIIGYTGWRIYKMLVRKPSVWSKCSGCSGCALKVRIDCDKK